MGFVWLWILRGGWRFIAGALLIAALVGAWVHHGNKRYAEGIASGVAKERLTWQPVVAAIRKQNAALDDLRAQAEVASERVAAASQKAQDARKASAALSGRLKAASRAKAAHPCAVAAVNSEAWGEVVK